MCFFEYLILRSAAKIIKLSAIRLSHCIKPVVKKVDRLYASYTLSIHELYIGRGAGEVRDMCGRGAGERLEKFGCKSVCCEEHLPQGPKILILDRILNPVKGLFGYVSMLSCLYQGCYKFYSLFGFQPPVEL